MPTLRSALLASTVALSLGLAACGGSSTPAASGDATDASSPGGGGKVTIASANFPENQILAEIYRQALADAGYDAEVTPRDTRPNILAALEADDIQVEPDYIGSFTEYYNKEKNGPDAEPVASGDLAATLEEAKKFAEEQGIRVLEPSPAQDQNAFVVTKEFSETNNVTKLSDLEDFDGPLVLGGTPECQTYSLCQPGLESTYGIDFTGFEQTDLGGALSIDKLKEGTVQLGEFLSSDGGIEANGFVLLEDDKNLQNVDNVVPVISSSVADDQTLIDVLNKISASMTTADLVKLNAGSSIDKKLPNQLATEYLTDKGLI